MAVAVAFDASSVACERRLQALRAAYMHVEWYRKLCQASAFHHAGVALVLQTSAEGQVAAVQREVGSKLASFGVELAKLAADFANHGRGSRDPCFAGGGP